MKARKMKELVEEKMQKKEKIVGQMNKYTGGIPKEARKHKRKLVLLIDKFRIHLPSHLDQVPQ